MDGHQPSIGWSPAASRMVTHQPKDGHPPERSVLMTGNLALRLKTKLTPGDNCNGWSTKIPSSVTHQPKDGYPPKEGVLQI